MFGDIGKMLKLAGEMKTRMPEMQAQLESAEYTAQAGGGAVSATVNGKLMVQKVRIDPQVLAEQDAGMLEDLVVAAVRAAQTEAAQAAAEAMKELTGGMNLPGMEGMFG
jgi:hypothetical protein